MSEHTHLENAPIKEALIDLQVKIQDGITTEELESHYGEFQEEYPIRNDIRLKRLAIPLNKDEPATGVEETLLGFKYSNSSGTQIVQFRKNGFTFSRLEPYETWEQMEEEAKRLWHYYQLSAKPLVVTRVATRFINELRIPLPIADFGDYLKAPPQLPEKIPQGISSFLTRLVNHDPNKEATAIITQALESMDHQVAPILLDIDVFVNKPFNAGENDYWNCLTGLREYKNDIFYESITQRTKELFG